MTDVERAVLDTIDLDAAVGLAASMVRFPSQIPNEGPLSQHLAREIRQWGVFDEVIAQPLVGDRANVIAVVRGTGGGRNILLNGHLDHASVYGAWTRDPYEPAVEGGRLYGAGLLDMKAAVACQFEAAAAIARSGAEHRGDVVVTAVVHHDTSGLGTRFFLSAWDRPIHAAIVGEPTNLTLLMAHGGALQFDITTTGSASHISRLDEGIDAIEQMTRVLGGLDVSRLRRDPERSIAGLPCMVIGQITGGNAANKTAESCTIRGDIRLSEGMTQDSVIDDIRELLDELRAADPRFAGDVHPIVYQRPFRTDRDSPAVGLVARAHQDVTGASAELTADPPASVFVTDAADLARAGIATAIYGPGDWRLMADEHISIEDMRTAVRVYALAAFRWAAGDASR
jgi:acetylornithine deacetylase